MNKDIKNDMKLYFNVLFDGLYNQGSTYTIIINPFIKLLEESLEYIKIIKELNNIDNKHHDFLKNNLNNNNNNDNNQVNFIFNNINNNINNDIKYIFKYIAVEGHAIGCLIINNNNNYTFIFSNTGDGIEKYHHCKVINGITYCKPFIIIEKVNMNIEEINKLFNNLETKVDLYNYLIFLLMDKNENKIKFEDFWYPAQISGNCCYLSIFLIYMYKLKLEHNISLEYSYIIDFIFKAISGKNILDNYNNLIKNNYKLTQNDYDIIKTVHILSDYYNKLYCNIDKKLKNIINIFNNNILLSKEMINNRSTINFYIDNDIKINKNDDDIIFYSNSYNNIYKDKDIINNNNNLIDLIYTSYNKLNKNNLNNLENLLDTINELLNNLYKLSIIRFKEAIYNILLIKSYYLIMDKFYNYFNKINIYDIINKKKFDQFNKDLIKKVYILNDLYKLTSMKITILNNNYHNISEFNKNVSVNEFFTEKIDNYEKKINFDDKDNDKCQLKEFETLYNKNYEIIKYYNFDIFVIITYYILLLVYILIPDDKKNIYKKYDVENNIIYYPNTTLGLKCIKQINELPIILINFEFNTNYYKQYYNNNINNDDYYIYFYFTYILLKKYDILYDNDLIILYNNIYKYIDDNNNFCYTEGNKKHNLKIDLISYIYTKINTDSTYILLNIKDTNYNFNNKTELDNNYVIFNQYIILNSLNNSDRKLLDDNKYLDISTYNNDNIITTYKYNYVILKELIFNRIQEYNNNNNDEYINKNYNNIDNLYFINNKINYLNNIIYTGFINNNKDLSNNKIIIKGKTYDTLYLPNNYNIYDYEIHIEGYKFKLNKIAEYLYNNYDNIDIKNMINNIYVLIFKVINYNINIDNYIKNLFDTFLDTNKQFYSSYNIYTDNINDLYKCLLYLMIYLISIITKKNNNNDMFIKIYKVLYNTYGEIVKDEYNTKYFINEYSLVNKYAIYIDNIIKYILLYIDNIDKIDKKNLKNDKYYFILNKNVRLYNNNIINEDKIFYDNIIVEYYNKIYFIYNGTKYLYKNVYTDKTKNLDYPYNNYNNIIINNECIFFNNKYLFFNYDNLTYKYIIDIIKNNKTYIKELLEKNNDNDIIYYTSPNMDYSMFHNIYNKNMKWTRNKYNEFECNYLNNNYIMTLNKHKDEKKNNNTYDKYERKYKKNNELKSIKLSELLKKFNKNDDIYIYLFNLLHIEDNKEKKYILFYKENNKENNKEIYFTIDFIYDNNLILEYKDGKLYYNNNEILYNKDIPYNIYIWISYIPYSLIYKKNNKYYLLCIKHNHKIINNICDWYFKIDNINNNKNNILIENINIEIHTSGLYVIINDNKIFETYILLLLFYRKSDCIYLLYLLLKQYKIIKTNIKEKNKNNLVNNNIKDNIFDVYYHKLNYYINHIVNDNKDFIINLKDKAENNNYIIIYNLNINLKMIKHISNNKTNNISNYNKQQYNDYLNKLYNEYLNKKKIFLNKLFNLSDKNNTIIYNIKYDIKYDIKYKYEYIN